MRRVVPLLATLIVVLCAAPAASAAELGLNVFGGANPDQQSPATLRDTGAKWARHFVFFDDFDPATGFPIYERLVREENALGVKTLLTFMSKEGRPPADREAFAAFMGDFAKRFAGEVEGYEVWNEADGDLYWRGGPDPAGYVDLLRRSYNAIKANDPGATVVFSPTIGNNFHFVEAAYAAGAKGAFDAMAVHTDTVCLDQAPSFFYREPDGRLGQYTFLGYREVLKVMQANGDGAKPIWMTEFGWSAATHVCEFGASAGQKPAGVGEDLQAQYLLQAMNCVEADPYVQVAMWFYDRDPSADGRMASSYGLRRSDGSQRPAYEAFKAWTGGGGRSNAPCGDFEGPGVTVLDPGAGFVLKDAANLVIRARSDAPDLKRILFTVDGAPDPISLPLAGPVGEREWGGARDLAPGPHTLTVYAIDQHDTPGPPVNVAFAKAGPDGTVPGGGGGGASGKARFGTVKLGGGGRTRTISFAALPGVTGGVVRIEWQTRRRGRWTRIHAKSLSARKPVKVKQKLRFGGSWRVRLLYLGKGPVKRTASCWILFKTTSAKTRLACPRGAVRPGR